MPSKKRVADFLNDNAGKIFSVGQIATSLGYEVSTTETYLHQLAGDGEVRRTARGYTCIERIPEEAHEGNNNGSEEGAHAS